MDNGPLVLGTIGLYLITHVVIRLALSPSLGIDDAEQILFAQHWALGYRFRQPPFFTWLLLPVVELLGPGVLAVSIVRYGLLAVTYLFLYLTACLWIGDRRLAALSVFSFSLIYVFAYYAHHDLTHTTALGAMIALSFYAFARLVMRPSLGSYLLLGLCFGLGMLAKWNFAMLAIGLPLTCLVLREQRHLVLTWKIFSAVAVMGMLVAPTARWMFDLGQSVDGVADNILNGAEPLGKAELLLRGGTALMMSVAVFPLPFLVVFLAVFAADLIGGRRSDDSAVTRGIGAAFLGWFMVITIGLHAVLIPVFGAVNFTERWMHPVLMILPIFLFAVLEKQRPSSRAMALYLGIIGIMVAVVVGTRLYRHALGADACGSCRDLTPFTELAADLESAGFKRGTIVAHGMHVGGNLKMLFPDSRLIDPAFPLAVWPIVDDEQAVGDGQCLLVWRADLDWRDDRPDAPARRERVLQFAVRQFGMSPTAERRTGRVEAAMYGSSTRRYALGYELTRENAGGCR
ncbi:MAG: ArnT family glycosyltransferase [Geminicoccaceae bacterium]